jgi:hypothetical protein
MLKCGFFLVELRGLEPLLLAAEIRVTSGFVTSHSGSVPLVACGFFLES